MIDVNKERLRISDSLNWAKLGRRWVMDSVGSKVRQSLTYGDWWRVEWAVYGSPPWSMFHAAEREVPRKVVELFQTQ